MNKFNKKCNDIYKFAVENKLDVHSTSSKNCTHFRKTIGWKKNTKFKFMVIDPKSELVIINGYYEVESPLASYNIITGYSSISITQQMMQSDLDKILLYLKLKKVQ